MSKPLRLFLSFLLVLKLIVPYTTFAAAIGEFTSVIGGVTQTREKEVILPVVKSPVEMRDLIVTARSASATMVFSDDSRIMLSENTKLEIKEFLFKDKSRTAFFSLATGKLAADVKKYIGGDNVLEVSSQTAIASVRGTGFEYVEDVNAQNQGVATISCTEGSLNLWALSATGEVLSTAVLLADQMAVITAGVITISAIGAAATLPAARTTEATKETASAAAPSLSTGAKIGIIAGAAALVGVTAVAIAAGARSVTNSCIGSDTADVRFRNDTGIALEAVLDGTRVATLAPGETSQWTVKTGVHSISFRNAATHVYTCGPFHPDLERCKEYTYACP
jgi:hypothetical protein